MADITDTDQIEQDLTQTRERMDRRLDALGDKLAPDQLVNDALSHVSGGTGSDFTQNLIAKAKANPLPTAVTAAGIVWLMASNRRQHARPARIASDVETQPSAPSRDGSGALAGRVQSARQALSSPDGKTFALGGAAALAGLIAGLVIPVTTAEEQALGTIADQIRTKGRGVAQDVADRGAEVARNALGAVKDSAKEHGLTADKPVGELIGDLRSGELATQVKQAAHDVASASKDSVQAQFGKGDQPQ